jgi:hypothetical protein
VEGEVTKTYENNREPTIQMYRGEEDDAYVVEIDTDSRDIEGKKGATIRVYVNDGCVFDGTEG